MNFRPTATLEKEDGIRVLEFSDKPIVDSETYENVIVDYDAKGHIVSIEILPFIPGKAVQDKKSKFISRGSLARA